MLYRPVGNVAHISNSKLRWREVGAENNDDILAWIKTLLTPRRREHTGSGGPQNFQDTKIYLEFFRPGFHRRHYPESSGSYFADNSRGAADYRNAGGGGAGYLRHLPLLYEDL